MECGHGLLLQLKPKQSTHSYLVRISFGSAFFFARVADCFSPGCFASAGGGTGAELPVGGGQGSPGCFASPGGMRGGTGA